MKFLRYIAVLFLVILLSCIEVRTLATNYNSFSEHLPENEKNSFISNVNIRLIKEEPTKRRIECFDVSDKEMIVIAQKETNNNTVCVYSNNGMFQYGYVFNNEGSCAVEWNGNDINIYFLRGGLVATVNNAGEIVRVLKLQNTIEYYDYLNQVIYSEKRMIGNNEYVLENDLGVFNAFASTYSTIVMKETLGNKKVLYDATSSAPLFGVAVIILIIFVIIYFFKIRERFSCKTGNGSLS